ncbi:aminoacyl-tRNA hydrolase [Treponema sp.]|uniref:aminoacyl-tRNA hydrolase n=1 Tax=Treponema sp. TaxID=166 RepID=UPI0025DC23B9|nr:aminoacyl-tRNA hydrolase [Treponema sp.]MCR5218390.1 aminoacyl-tRNA hydrolase [Treponema sp.]
MIQLVAFLGNYGKEYENTRHNAAWLFEKSLSFSSSLSYQNKFKAEFATADYEDIVRRLNGGESKALPENAPKKLYFMKPLTYMNLSGEAVGEAARFYKIPASDILIVHDEIELAPGILSLKWSGGLGGHNGLRSVKSVFNTADFWRLRIGVGKPADGNVADYVLGSFTQDEMITLSQVFVKCSELFSKMLTAKDMDNLLKSWSKVKL